MQPKQPLSQKEGRHSPVHQRPPQISIGYYNLRGKAQVPRLLLEYLKVDYQDKLFTIQEWQKYASEHIEQFQFALLPYLKEGDFVVTDSVPICIYIINRFGHQDLLGRNLKDRAIVDMYIWTIPYMDNVITINCQQKSQQQLMKFKMQQWKVNVCPRLIKIEQAASEQGWFLGYLTLIDFSIYELVRYMQNIFDMVHQDLPKLKRIQKEVGGLKQIKDYEASTRAITEWCPTKLLENMKSLMNKTENRSENQEKVNRKTEKEKNEK